MQTPASKNCETKAVRYLAIVERNKRWKWDCYKEEQVLIWLILTAILIVIRVLFELNYIDINLPFNIAATWSTTCLRYQKGQCKPFSPFMLTLKLNCHFFKKFLKIRYSFRLWYKNMPLTKDSPYCHSNVWCIPWACHDV